MVPSLLAKGGGHECEQGEPERDEHTHVAQTVVAVQLVHQKDLKRQVNEANKVSVLTVFMVRSSFFTQYP